LKPPISELIRRNLADPDRRVGGRLRADDLDQAAAALGTGPDPIAGERTLALVVHSRDNRAGCFTLLAMLNPIRFLVRRTMQVARWDQCWLVTDSRLILRSGGDLVDIPWERMRLARPSGGVASFFGWEFVDLRWTGDGGEELEEHVMTPAHASVARLVRAMVRARDGDGWTTDRPSWPESPAGDPAGLASAHAALDADDGRAATLLKRLQQAWLQGRADDVQTLELSRRIVLFARTTAWGRGARDGAWVSVLRPAELRAAVSSTVGDLELVPDDDADEGWTTWVHLHSAADAGGRAIAETLVLLASGRLDISLPRTDLRLRVRDREGWTAWTLEQRYAGSWMSLHLSDFSAQNRIFKRVLAAEATVLAYRCVIDPAAPAETVVEAPRSETLARLAEADPESAPAQFSVARPQVSTARMTDNASPERRAKRKAALQKARAEAPPRAWSQSGTANLVGGFTSAIIGLPLLWCFVMPLCFVLLEAVGRSVRMLDVEMAKGVLGAWVSLGGFTSAGLSLVQGIIGIVQLSKPRSARWVGVIIGGCSVLAVFLGNFVGALGGLLAVWLGTRPDTAAATSDAGPASAG
jgi:hypothetical protein